MDDFRAALAQHVDALLADGVEPIFLLVELVGAEGLRLSRDPEALPHFRETCLATLSGAAGDCPAFSCGDTRVVALLSGYDRLKTFALIEKMRRMIPLLSQSYDTVVAPEFDTIEYDETTGIAGVVNQLTAPRRQAEAA
jgi:hypothetical protein